MTRRITFAGALFLYDGIQLFEGRDAIGGHYIGVAIARIDSGEDAYAVFGVSPRELQRFRIGLIDLRSLIEQRVESEWFIGDLEEADSDLVVFAESQDEPAPNEYLPDEGLFISGSPELDGAWVRSESQARNTLALEIELESSAPSDEHRIGVEKLGGALLHIQSFVKNAYRKLRSLHPGVQQRSNRDVAPLLDVAVPALPGSFRVLLIPSADTVNLFGASEIERALEAVDFMLSEVDDPAETLNHVREYSGHTASSLVRLLRFLAESELSLTYSWASPAKELVSSRRIAQRNAVPLIEALSSSANLQVEERIIVGRLRKVNLDSDTWGASSITDDKNYHGKIRGGVRLDHLVTDEVYVFKCEEEVEEITGTGREIHTLYLRSTPLRHE